MVGTSLLQDNGEKIKSTWFLQSYLEDKFGVKPQFLCAIFLPWVIKKRPFCCESLRNVHCPTRFYIGSLVLILEALHIAGVAYRDLKPEPWRHFVRMNGGPDVIVMGMTSDVNEWAYKKANIRIHFLHSNRDIFGDDCPRKMSLIWFSFLPHEPTTHNISLSIFFRAFFAKRHTFLDGMSWGECDARFTGIFEVGWLWPCQRSYGWKQNLHSGRYSSLVSSFQALPLVYSFFHETFLVSLV